jgi:hypothetical protein
MGDFNEGAEDFCAGSSARDPAWSIPSLRSFAQGPLRETLLGL